MNVSFMLKQCKADMRKIELAIARNKTVEEVQWRARQLQDSVLVLFSFYKQEQEANRDGQYNDSGVDP